MFKNPSLNNVFSRHFDGFYIYSNSTKIEVILERLANALSKNYKVLYISTDDICVLDDDIYHLNIFNKKALKSLYKLKFDCVFVENISFIYEIRLPKNCKLIANGFSKNDLRHFLGRRTRFLKFIYNDNCFKIFNKNCEFTYNFKPKSKQIFHLNTLPKDYEKELEFYFSCIKQGFYFDDFRASRKDEFFQAFANGYVKFQDFSTVKDFSKEYFWLENHRINCDFIIDIELFCKAKILKKPQKSSDKIIIKIIKTFKRLWNLK